MRRLVGLILAAGMATAAWGQDRTPAQRQTLNELAHVLGQSHALRQACEGASDQYWRVRMSQLLQAEAPDQTFDRALREAFNTGYAAAQAQFQACDAKSRGEAAQIARRGAALAESAAGP
ncbi:MAG TPA: TIGR02301 family protein [Caulobacteraceae bacterium]|nr:TIGR02301 family protein [Caulobacteraceae bacterium]